MRKLFSIPKFRTPLSPIKIPLIWLLVLTIFLFKVCGFAGSIGEWFTIQDPCWHIICSQLPIDLAVIIFVIALSRFFEVKISEDKCHFRAWLLPAVGIVGCTIFINFLWGVFLALFDNLLQLHLNLEPQLFEDIIANLSNRYQAMAMLFLIGIVGPVAEELLFRYFFYRSLKSCISAHWAMLIVAFIFALAHGNLMAFGGTFFIGIGLTLIYEQTRNLWAPIFAHSLNNAISFAVIFCSEVVNRA